VLATNPLTVLTYILVMASNEHKKLADIIKGVHNHLRRQFQSCKEDETIVDSLWDEHCKRVDVLSNYAMAMQTLASVHWKQNNTTSRIDWCHSTIMDYFFNGWMQKCLEKDYKWKMKNEKDGSVNGIEEDVKECHHVREKISSGNKLRLLDVGSCYNPFCAYEEYSTVAVDLCPATSSVYKCDFIKVQVRPFPSEDISIYFQKLTSPILSLPASTFHIVVFSLLLEYLPLQSQRLICCKKAVELLVDNGLLLIITPDSKHQNYNSRMMKSWKFSLESLGLKRVVYVKQKHLHCLAFRKISKQFQDLLRHTVLTEFSSGLYIPQDFNDFTSQTLPDASVPLKQVDDSQVIKNNFIELPDSSCFD